MSAVQAIPLAELQPPQIHIDVQAMQDVLYDILATGIDVEQGDGEVPSAAIERFLHEHARTPKSADEFRAFFAEHGLSVRVRPLMQHAALALPPIEPPVAAPPPPTLVSPEPAIEVIEVEAVTGAHRVAPPQLPAAVPAPAPRPRIGLIMAVVAATCATSVLAFTIYECFETIATLRAEVDRSHQANEQNDQAIRALRDRALGLESTIAATGELVQRVDQKSDLVLQSLLPVEGKRMHRRSSETSAAARQ